MPLCLRVKLLSDTAPGSGTGEAGRIDRAVVRDRLGLPLLPGRGLKGALREAALETAEALDAAGFGDVLASAMIERLFGVPGMAASGWLHLGNARLADAVDLEPWLSWAATQAPTVFGPAAVLKALTGLRVQTRIARLTGGPAPDTLRSTQIVARGHQFIAPVSLIPPPDDNRGDIATMRDALAFSCMALRRIGLSRNRGLGAVEVTLEDEGSSDLCAAALARVARRMEGQPQ